VERVVYQLDYRDLIHTDSKNDNPVVLWIIATHTDMPINNRIYRREEVEQAVKTWIYPYNKPVLVHHN